MEMKCRDVEQGGGVATFIREGLSYIREATPLDIEGIVVKIQINKKSINISNIYLKPKPDPDLNSLKEIFSKPSTILCGDMNAKNTLWGSDRNDARGNIIADLIDEYDLTVLNTGEGTFIKQDGTLSHLDIGVASSNLAAKCRWEVLDSCWNSDHLPTQITYGEAPDIEDGHFKKWNFRKADWGNFSSQVSEKINEKLLLPSIQESCKLISTEIEKLAENNIPQTNPINNTKRMVPFWNEDCNAAVKNKEKLRKKMHDSKTLPDGNLYRKAKAKTQYIIKNSKKEHWQDYCNTLNDKTKLGAVWKMSKKMAGIKSTTKIANIREGNSIQIKNVDKANALARAFAANSSDKNYTAEFKINRSRLKDDNSKIETPETRKGQPADNQENNTLLAVNEKFSIDELESAIAQCKNGTAPGEDMITYEMLKHFPPSSLVIILELYNRIWETGILPQNWKHSIVLPFVKPGKDPSSPDSYRPIALTSALCKIMERMITNRLNWFMESNKLFNPMQTGFRKNKSTLDHIMRLQSEVQNSINHGQYTAGVFLDFSKAYDMLWKDGLMHKLAQLKVSGNMYNFIDNFLSDRTFQVKVGNCLSETLKLENGTPQGSVISPILFLIMINDFPETSNNVKNAIFADDSSIWKSGRDLSKIASALQIELNKIQEWCDQWGFILSKEKTIAVIFARKRIEHIPILKLGDKTIEWKKEVKFLGVIFDTRLTWVQHIDYIVERCKKRLNFMRSVSGIAWGANKESLLIIYKALIRSVIDYGCSAYNTASDNVKYKLDKIQAQALRISCGAMKCTAVAALQVECGEMPLRLRREGLQYKYGIKIKNTKDHPSVEILKQNVKIKRNKTSFAKETVKYLNQIPPTVGPQIGLTPPWHHKPIKPVFELHSKVSRTMAPAIIKQLALELLAKYQDYIKVYTDGSKDPRGIVGAAYCIASLNITRNFRLSDDVSVYTAEMVAIREALRFILNHKIIKAIVATDSLSVLQSLQSGVSHSRPTLLEELRLTIDQIQTMGGDLIFIWVPAHCGINGNEHADLLAKRALSNKKIDKPIDLELKEAFIVVDNHITEKWQKEWEEGKTGRALFEIEPAVSHRIKYTHKSRAQESMITRMRLGKCYLNSYLHKISVRPDGLCDHCNEIETIEHFILKCKANKELTNEIVSSCKTLKLIANVANVLSNKPLSNYLYSFIKAQKRRV